MRFFGIKERWYDLKGYEWKVYENLYMM